MFNLQQQDHEWPYLRPIKASCLNLIYKTYQDLSNKLEISTFSNCIITPMGQSPGISENPTKNAIIDDCDYYSVISFETEKYCITAIEGNILYGGYFRNQWGHFLLNSTARLWYLFKHPKENFDKIIFFTDTPHKSQLKNNFQSFFELAGIKDKILICNTSIKITGTLTVPEIALENSVKFCVGK